ncbi:MAG: hypothetical protein AB1705_10530 [Verrucomicrobiota bacterium]
MHRFLKRWARWTALCAWCLLLPAPAQAALQFDVFLGYDNIVREANWFPVVCEVHNDGPSFKAVFELTSEQGGRGQARRMAVELPTNTRKRFVIPVFGSGGRYNVWHARLVDERGKVRAEATNLRARKDVSWRTMVIGAVPRTFAGAPSMPEGRSSRADIQPEVARMQPDVFPDSAIALEGLNVIYLNSEKALDLKLPQINALIAWVQAGGHLIVAVEQASDVNGTPWLKALLPCEFTGVATATSDGALQEWLVSGKSATVVTPSSTPSPRPGVRPSSSRTVSTVNPFSRLSPDATFEQTPMPCATTALLDGRTVLSAGGQPLVIEANRGRGKVTALTFSPEREPFRSWKNRSWFWARLVEAPSEAFVEGTSNAYSYGGNSIDGVFGAMIDSRQVRKLPVSWLLLLLVAYLVVIGPLDQYWLKKINRQMLTWITFPCYVVFFSLLIYWIGFMLRAGETEWNEVQIVDVLPRAQRAELRGRTYASIYSPSNARYNLTGRQPQATLRGEFQGSWAGNQESTRASVEHRGDGFSAEVFVPVWTSQLFISDWWQPHDLPLRATLSNPGPNAEVTVENLLDRPLTEARLVYRERVYTFGELPSRQSKTFSLGSMSSTRIEDFVRQNGGQFAAAIQDRRRSFGGDSNFRLSNLPLCSMATSFVSELDANTSGPYGYAGSFVTPEGLDLSWLVDRGDAVLLAWDAGHVFTQPLNDFSPRRSAKNTLLRVALHTSEATPQ